MKLSAKTGVALTITTLSLVVTVGAAASEPAYQPEEDPLVYLRQVPADAAHVDTSDTTYHPEEDPLVYLRQVPADAAHVDTSDTTYHPEEDPLVYLRQVPADAAHVDTVGVGALDTTSLNDAWVIHCCTAYSEDVPSTSITPLPTFLVTPLSTSAAHVGMMNQLRNLTEPNAIAWGWSQGLANDQASSGMTQYSGSTA